MRETFRPDLGDGLFGVGLAGIGVILLAIFVAPAAALVLLVLVVAWWLAFLGYQLVRGSRGVLAVKRATMYGFAWTTWLSP